MKIYLILLFICLRVVFQAQCNWTAGVTSQNNSFTLTCQDTILNIQAANTCTNPVSYLWNGPGVSAITQSLSVSMPGTYSLNVTDVNTSCVNTLTFAIGVSTTIPVFTLNTNSVVITCLTGVVTLTAVAQTPTNNISFSWYSINMPPPVGPPLYVSNSATSLFNPGSTGSHSVVLRDLSNGCESIITFTIFNQAIFPVFSVSASNNFLLGCWPADTIFITNIALSNTNTAFSYSFVPPGSPATFPLPGPLLSGNTPSLVTSIPGSYTIVVQDNSNSCQTPVVVNIMQSNTLNINYSHTVTPNGIVNFSNTSIGTSSNTNYVWDYGDGTTGTGATSAHTYSNGGIHYVTLQTINPSCMSASDSVNVNTIPCLANSNYSLTFSGTPQTWYAVPGYYGNVTNAVWNWGDGTSTNAMFPSHTYSAAGLYNICLTITVSCSNSSTTCANYNIYKYSPEQQLVNVTVVKTLPLGVGLKETSMNNDGVQLLPNPANDYLFIEGIREGKVNFYNNLGKLVLTQVIDNREIKTKIPITVLSSGVYFVHISGGNESIVKKIVISH